MKRKLVNWIRGFLGLNTVEGDILKSAGEFTTNIFRDARVDSVTEKLIGLLEELTARRKCNTEFWRAHVDNCNALSAQVFQLIKKFHDAIEKRASLPG